MNRKVITCIVCPNGCELTTYYNDNNSLVIEGAECERGISWAKQEITNPKRIITSSVLVKNGTQPLVSVKTDTPIPLDKISTIMNEIKSVLIEAPVDINQLILKNAANTGASIIATRKISKKN